MSLLELRNLQKSYTMEGRLQPVVNVPDFTLQAGEEVALQGSSGSGKTTLLHLISGLLLPDSGSVSVRDVDLTQLNEAERDRHRARFIGYIFQTFHLLPAFTCLENVLLGMRFAGQAEPERARKLLARVGLSDRLHHRPSQLSTGQQQRVAVARALANKPALVLADEPTGNLDAVHGAQVLQLIREICIEEKAALLLVSHDPQVLSRFTRVVDFSILNRALTAPMANSAQR